MECEGDNMHINNGVNITTGQSGKGCDIPNCNYNNIAYLEELKKHSMYIGNSTRGFWIWYDNNKGDISCYLINGQETKRFLCFNDHDIEKIFTISEDFDISMTDIID